ncbi:MAG: helix-hairpin-helix domain-containing protein, partial [Chloroflexi bacterium]|nr:helix-hairpin-helix domain-containing protein [Chloroflexota bacterium]
ELETLPGIGPTIARAIVDYREQSGRFKTLDEIKKVRGIGDALYDRIKDKISLD